MLEQVREMMKVGAQRLDSLHNSQMAAQAVSGVMASVMLRQQSVMREVANWELEVMKMMWELSQIVADGENSTL